MLKQTTQNPIQGVTKTTTSAMYVGLYHFIEG